MLYSRLKGTGVAMVTPFNENNSVDFEALTKLTNHLIDGGVSYLVVMGTTGESVTLTTEEKNEVVKCVQDANKGKLPIVLGIGANNTQQVIETIKNTDFQGIDAILSVSPYYNKPTQEGIYQHYKAISEVSPRPIILYNVPGRTASNISPNTALRLARNYENIIAIKEAAGDMTQSMELIKNKPEGFLVISGDDILTLPFIACGGDGVISVVGNAFPAQFSSLTNLALEGKIEAARKIHYSLNEIIDNLFVEGNPAGIKAALKIIGVCDDGIRLPLVKVSDNTYNKLQTLIEKL